MKFTINSLILWPKNHEYQPNIIPFASDKINIITGASCTGKSAIIPIIDYCLGADKCMIPVGVIRNACEWFGVLFDLEGEQLLLCRKEPREQQSTGEMCLLRDVTVEIPDVVEKNINQKAVKDILNELFSMSFLELDTNTGFFTQKPSYRDFMAFLFQPQNIIANANVMFYKADSMEHRQKLINLFPYALGAVTPKVLAARQELDRIKKERDRTERDLKNIQQVAIGWQQEVKSWLSRAKEYGLTDFILSADTAFEEQIHQLKSISSKTEMDSTVLANNIKDMTVELVQLRKEEAAISAALYEAQSRLESMQKLEKSVLQYDGALQIQLNRLNISGWLKELSLVGNVCPLCGGMHEGATAELKQLCNAIAEIEQTAGDLKSTPVAFERELQAVSTEITILTQKLSAIRNRIQEESNVTNALSTQKYTLSGISRFLGKMEVTVQTYEKIGQDSELSQRLRELDARIEELKEIVNEGQIRKKIESSLSYINFEASKLISKLNAEHPDSPIEFIVNELTIRIKSLNGRDDYLWEIGSASNWLAYHLVVSLAFQKFFQVRRSVAVPNFIIYDQPSQVYFPQKLSEKPKEGEDAQLEKDEDKEAVRKIFELFSSAVSDNNFDLQIIVMEHADEEIWGNIRVIHGLGFL
jgi:Protein of unknown function (DUF3732).